MGYSWVHPGLQFHRRFHIPPSDLNHRGRVPPCNFYSRDICPEMKEEPRTGLGLFKFFCVGFGEGGHINFIGVGQDLGHKMQICLVLAVPLVHAALAQGMRGSLP